MAFPPSAPVEATSLASVTALATDPPKHPYIQPRTNALPLTLYIVRVPGSRDVFLTPHKPRDKVVSAEDVQSSLYFVHVNNAADRDLSDTDQPEIRPITAPSGGSTHLSPVSESNDVHRKAVPPRLPPRRQPRSGPITPPYPLDDEPPRHLQQRPGSPPKGLAQIARKPLHQASANGRAYPPVLLDITNKSRARQQDQERANLLPPLPRRPLPTPPAEMEPSESVHSENVRLLRESSHDAESNPYFKRYDSVAHVNPFANETTNSGVVDLETFQTPAINIERTAALDTLNTAATLTAGSTAPTNPLEPGSLTLIRRDPSSHHQWNVASIYDPPVREVSSAALLNPPTAGRRVKKGGAPLYLDITNPAYLKFNEQQRPMSQASERTSTEGSVTRTSKSSDSTPQPDDTFRRRLYMPGSKHGVHNYGHTKHLSVDSAVTDDAMKKTMRQRSSIDFSIPPSDRRSKGYSFTSPWDGRCEFATGAAGKTLKCKHTLPNDQRVETVSELRFNLPTATSHSHTPTSTAEKRKSYFSHLRQRSSGSGDDENGSLTSASFLSDRGSITPNILVDEDGRLDLSLGQERAGGGFGGKQAKLGKLIIEPEGLKMLDLLVAANLGLWWRAYERM